MTSWIIAFYHRVNTQETCNDAVRTEPLSLVYVPNRYLVPDRFKTQEMCIKAVEVSPFQLGDVPDHYMTLDICIKVVEEDP